MKPSPPLLALLLCVLLSACGAGGVREPGFSSLAPISARPGMAIGGPPATPTPEPPLPTEQAEGLTVTASVAGGGIYRVGKWLPVRVTVQNDGPDMQGEVRVSAGRGGASYAATLDLPRGSRKSATIYALMASFSRRLTVRVVRGGAQVAQQQLVVEPHPAADRLVGIVAAEGSAPRLPPALPNDTRLVAVPLALAALPERAAGLSSLDTLVLDDVATTELSDVQRGALREWVARGGQLLLGGGTGAARTLAGLPDELRPVQLAGVAAVPAASLLPGSIAATDLAVAQATPLGGAEQVSGGPLSATAPPRAERLLGKGAATFFALPLSAPALAAWQQAPALWDALLRPPPAMQPGFGPSDITPEQMIEGNVASSLVRLPALALPSLALLGLLLLSYILLVGPGTYLVLRLIDRQALGWVVVPAITVVFAGLAYGVGYAQRGGDVVLNQVSLVEPLDGASARVRSFVGLFSPQRASYTLDISGDPLLRPISLQGPWDTSEQGGVFQQQRASAIDVPQWSMRALVAEANVPFSGLAARVTLKNGALAADISNNTGQTLRDVVLVQDINVAHVGDLAPGERRSVAFENASGPALVQRRTKFGGAPLSYLIYSDLIDAQNTGPGQPLPPAIQLRQGLLDAIYSAGPIQRNAAPLLFAWADGAPLDVSLPDQRVDRQQLTLITIEPELVVEAGAVALGQGWLDHNLLLPDPTDTQSVCLGGQGLGVSLFGEPTVLTLTLPRALRALRADELHLLPGADGPWPENITIELYDWQAAQWVKQAVRRPASVAVEQPARFLGPDNGQIRARISGTIDPQKGGGCVYLDASLKGTIE